MREFTVSLGGATLANQPVTLVFVNPPAAPNMNIEFLRYWCSQQGSTTSAQQRVQRETQASVFPTLVSATPPKLKPATVADVHPDDGPLVAPPTLLTTAAS